MNEPQTTLSPDEEKRTTEEFIRLDFGWPHISTEFGSGKRYKELSDAGYFDRACEHIRAKLEGNQPLDPFEVEFWDENSGLYYEKKRRAKLETAPV